MPTQGNVILYDEAQAEVINLGHANIQRSGDAKIGGMENIFRYTNVVFYQGDNGEGIALTGTFNPPFTSVGVAWTTSSGTNPIPTLEKWQREGRRLTYEDEVQTLTSVQIALFDYDLTPGVPLSQIAYYNLKLEEGII
jgi:hypothetical protein